MLTIKDLSASKELDRAAMGAVAGGNAPSIFGFNFANDLYDVLGAAYQSDLTGIANVGNHGSLVFNYVENEKKVIV